MDTFEMQSPVSSLMNWYVFVVWDSGIQMDNMIGSSGRGFQRQKETVTRGDIGIDFFPVLHADIWADSEKF